MPPTDEYGQYPDHLLKFGKILSTNGLREVEAFVESMKWGQAGAVYVGEGMTIEPRDVPTEVVYSDNIKYLTLRSPEVDEDVEITDIMDGYGNIVRQIRHEPPQFINVKHVFPEKAKEQEEIYTQAIDALREYKPEPLTFDNPEFDYGPGKLPAFYDQEYESSAEIAEKWNDDSLIGLCAICGMDDAPIVKHYGSATGTDAYCKWCAELEAINWHLKLLGERPKETKDQLPWILRLDYVRILFVFLFVWTMIIFLLQTLTATADPVVLTILMTFTGALGVIDGKRHGGPVD